MNLVWWSLLGLAIVYIVFIFAPAVVSYFAVFGRKQDIPLDKRDLSQTYFAPHMPQITESFRLYDAIEFRPVSLRAYDGETLTAQYCPGTNGRTVIFFHGYRASPRNNFSQQAVDFHRQGYELLLVNQRGHGESGGKQTTFGLAERQDVIAWTNWAAQNNPDGKVLLYGVSMGAAAVAYAAELLNREQVAAMVLDSGFICPYDMLALESKKRSVPYRTVLPIVRLLMKLFHKLDIQETTLPSLEKTQIPALFLCGTADETVSDQLVRQAYHHCASPKELVVAEGAAHTLAYLAGGFPVKSQIIAFADRYFAAE